MDTQTLLKKVSYNICHIKVGYERPAVYVPDRLEFPKDFSRTHLNFKTMKLWQPKEDYLLLLFKRLLGVLSQ